MSMSVAQPWTVARPSAPVAPRCRGWQPARRAIVMRSMDDSVGTRTEANGVEFPLDTMADMTSNPYEGPKGSSHANGQASGHGGEAGSSKSTREGAHAPKIKVRRVPNPLKNAPVPAQARTAVPARRSTDDPSPALTDRARSSSAMRIAQAEASAQRAEVLDLRRELAASQQMVLEARREAKEARAEAATLRRKVKDKEEQVATLEDSLRVHKDQLALARQEVAAAREDIKASNKYLVDALIQLEQGAADRNRLREDLAEAQEGLAQAKLEMTTFTEQLQAVREMMQAAVAMDSGVTPEEAEGILREISDMAGEMGGSAEDVLSEVTKEVRSDPISKRAAAAEEAVKTFQSLMESVDDIGARRAASGSASNEALGLFENLSRLAKGLVTDAESDEKLSDMFGHLGGQGKKSRERRQQEQAQPRAESQGQ